MQDARSSFDARIRAMAHRSRYDPAMSGDLAVTICTKDNERTIETALRSVREIARTIIVVDSGSRDRTLEIARAFGARIVERPWTGAVDQKQFAMDQGRDHRWVLLLDSDEALDAELQESIRSVVATDDPSYAGWALNRIVILLGRRLRYTFQPEWRVRLARGGASRVAGIGADGQGGHDRVEVQGRVGRLRGNCLHDSWVDLPDMFRRYVALSQRAGAHHPGGGRLIDVLVRPGAAFFKQYVLRRGFLDGRLGLIAAAGVAAGVLMKHAFIAERREARSTTKSGA